MKKATEVQIKEWKEKYGDIHMVESADGQCVAYLRRPTRQEMGLAAKKSQSNPLAFNDVIIQACWLHGDDQMRADDQYYFGLCQALEDIISTVQAHVKKL